MTENKFMKKAIDISKKNMRANSGGPFGAVIVKNGKVIATGTNQVTSKNDPTAHAEVVAIRKACKKINSYELEDCEIYTSCEPCPMCVGAIYWARPKKVYYANTKKDAAEIGFDDYFIYEELKNIPEERTIQMIQLKDCYQEAKEVFKEWGLKKDKILY